jgi:hypothetical protein
MSAARGIRVPKSWAIASFAELNPATAELRPKYLPPGPANILDLCQSQGADVRRRSVDPMSTLKPLIASKNVSRREGMPVENHLARLRTSLLKAIRPRLVKGIPMRTVQIFRWPNR